MTRLRPIESGGDNPRGLRTYRDAPFIFRVEIHEGRFVVSFTAQPFTKEVVDVLNKWVLDGAKAECLVTTFPDIKALNRFESDPSDENSKDLSTLDKAPWPVARASILEADPRTLYTVNVIQPADSVRQVYQYSSVNFWRLLETHSKQQQATDPTAMVRVVVASLSDELIGELIEVSAPAERVEEMLKCWEQAKDHDLIAGAVLEMTQPGD